MDASDSVEGDCGRGDVYALAFNTPIIKIDSIYIDLNEAMKKSDAKNCEHFSIRGYVAEIQKKDPKACLPFPASSDSVDQTGMLHPMRIPRFRWWSCRNCLQEINSKNVGIVTNCCDEMNGAVSNVSNVQGIERPVQLCASEKNDEVALKALIGDHDNVFADDSINRIPCPESSPCVNKLGGTGFNQLNDSGLPKKIDDCSKSLQKKKQIFVDDQTMMDCGTSNAVHIVENFHESNTEIEGIKQTFEANSGDEEFLCKKSPKVRLLSDLFPENKFNIPSKAMPRPYSPKGFKNQNCKKSVLPDEDWRPPHINSRKSLKKKLSFFNGDPKSSHIGNVYTDSISEQTAPCGVYFSPDTESQSAKRKVDGNCIPVKMKLKFCKKNAMGIAEDGSTALFPLNNRLFSEAPKKNGLYSPCKDGLFEHGCCRNYITGPDMGHDLFLKQQKPSREYLIVNKSRDYNHAGNPSTLACVPAGPSMSRHDQGAHNISSATPFLNGKSSEHETFSLMQQKDLDNPNRMADDVPMEIVELMAKNQHERRCCPEGTLADPWSNNAGGIIDFSAPFCASNGAQNWRLNQHKSPRSLDNWSNKTPRFPERELCFKDYHQRPNAFSCRDKGPMHSSETISAMHLLSLMDAGIQPHTSPGFHKIIAPPEETTFTPNGNPPSENCCHCFPSCSCGVENKKMDEFVGEASCTAPLKPKRGRPRKVVASANTETGSLPKKKRGRPRKSVPTTQNHETLVSDLFPNHHGGAGASILETGICGLNQNPADFSVPVAGNIYTNWR